MTFGNLLNASAERNPRRAAIVLEKRVSRMREGCAVVDREAKKQKEEWQK
jgi:hypothetical protein